MILTYYVTNAFTETESSNIKRNLNTKICTTNKIEAIESEFCFYVEVNRTLTEVEECKLKCMLKSFDGCISDESSLQTESKNNFFVEIGPKLYFLCPFWNSDVAIRASAVLPVTRVKRTIRYVITSIKDYNCDMKNTITASLYDKATECVYENHTKNFKVSFKSEPWCKIDNIEK